MELSWKLWSACVSGFILFRCILCDESGTVSWTCICAPGPLVALNYTPISNCSSTCDCIPGSNVGGWKCSCATKKTHSAGSIYDAGCFSACNCTSGSAETLTAPNRRISSRGVIVILLVCAVITTMAFLSSVACCFYRKNRPSRWIASSGKDSSWNSSANLISHHSASFQEFQLKVTSPLNPITRCLTIFLPRTESGTMPGTITQFSYIELEQATNKFSNDNLIGIGGSSNVYRGNLKDGRIVAIKKLNLPGQRDADSGFLTEIEMISRLNHCHVVPLLGYCLENQGKLSMRLLVFEYMSNGNLRDCLDRRQRKEPLDWNKRVTIALGAARGLEYLHEAAAPRILHRDIKSTNILLDYTYRAKITDLGMAKCLVGDDLTSYSSSPARMLGTFGYFAPEYAIVGKASLKSDVFSFGVVVLELITGRQAIQKSSKKTDESLVIWATARLHDSKLVVTELPDPLLKGNFPEEEMQTMAHLARECLQWDPDMRPTMSEVVQMITTISTAKSKRRNFPASFVMSSSRGLKGTSEIVPSQDSAGRSGQNQEISEARHLRCSLPLSGDQNSCKDQQKTFETAVSAEYIERLILQTSSNGQSWRSLGDEIVDLTEPRFESFV